MYYAFKHLQKLGLILKLYFVLYCEKSTAQSNGVKQYWEDIGGKELISALNSNDQNYVVAKNVILFIGAGMSLSAVTSARKLKQKTASSSLEKTRLAMDGLPHTALSRTYPLGGQTPDAASTATAYLGGVKTRTGLVGLASTVQGANCKDPIIENAQVKSFLTDAFEKGKWLGIVTDVQITHVSVAAAYAFAPAASWYSDADVPSTVRGTCPDIAKQFFSASHMYRVVLGGGRKHFFPSSSFDPEYSTKKNARLEGTDVIKRWKMKNGQNNKNALYVWNLNQFDKVKSDTTDFLLGLFEPEEMKYDGERLNDVGGEPSLAEMTQKALSILSRSGKGFVLLVHAGRIDEAFSIANSTTALGNLLAFDEAIQVALKVVNQAKTLVIVSANHGRTAFKSMNDSQDTQFSPAIGSTSVEDVSIWARGPSAFLFHGVHEQVYIATVIRYALCLEIDELTCLTRKSRAEAGPINVFGIKISVGFVEVILKAIFVLLLVLSVYICILGIRRLHGKLQERINRRITEPKAPKGEDVYDYYDAQNEIYYAELPENLSTLLNMVTATTSPLSRNESRENALELPETVKPASVLNLLSAKPAQLQQAEVIDEFRGNVSVDKPLVLKPSESNDTSSDDTSGEES